MNFNLQICHDEKWNWTVNFGQKLRAGKFFSWQVFLGEINPWSCCWSITLYSLTFSTFINTLGQIDSFGFEECHSWSLSGHSANTWHFRASCRCQFHQHFTSSFYSWRFQNRRKTYSLTVFFDLLGSTSVRAACKMFMKLTQGQQSVTSTLFF